MLRKQLVKMTKKSNSNNGVINAKDTPISELLNKVVIPKVISKNVLSSTPNELIAKLMSSLVGFGQQVQDPYNYQKSASEQRTRLEKICSLKDEDFGDPKNRLFPIYTEELAKQALRFSKMASNGLDLEKKIFERYPNLNENAHK